MSDKAHAHARDAHHMHCLATYNEICLRLYAYAAASLPSGAVAFPPLPTWRNGLASAVSISAFLTDELLGPGSRLGNSTGLYVLTDEVIRRLAWGGPTNGARLSTDLELNGPFADFFAARWDQVADDFFGGRSASRHVAFGAALRAVYPFGFEAALEQAVPDFVAWLQAGVIELDRAA